MLNLVFSTLILTVAILVWAAFELQYQRDAYRTLWCIEVLKNDPIHPVCGDQ